MISINEINHLHGINPSSPSPVIPASFRRKSTKGRRAGPAAT